MRPLIHGPMELMVADAEKLVLSDYRFGKKIRYASRKARADTRKRVKGRFVKAGEAYDYDPLVVRDF